MGPAIGKVMGSDGHCLGGRGRIDRSSFEGFGKDWRRDRGPTRPGGLTFDRRVKVGLDVCEVASVAWSKYSGICWSIGRRDESPK